MARHLKVARGTCTPPSAAADAGHRRAVGPPTRGNRLLLIVSSVLLGLWILMLVWLVLIVQRGDALGRGS